MSKKILLTGDRPTGKLHLGHYVGSIQNRIRLQNEVDTSFYMVADVQGLTDNADNPEKIRDNVLEVVLDNLACGLDPNKTNIFIQSQIHEIAELTVFFMNLVTLQQLSHNPTIKTEAKEKGFNLNSKLEDENIQDLAQKGIPMGFLNYPVSQAADILFCRASIVPVGADQMPVIEQTNDIAKKFNAMYQTELFPKVNGVVGSVARLVGTDGNAKMSKSLGNCIYLSDSDEEIKKKVMQAYTDPGHIKVEDPGKVEGNVVFTYLDVFDPNKEEVEELKKQYQKGGLGDVVLKARLTKVLIDLITPIRTKREELAKDKQAIIEIIKAGNKKAAEYGQETMREARKAMKIDYFS
ncbi:MAG: tryptophan--tRNA ligase [Candidatus Pacebacteria bacterium]|nr:tryptophan--tRNA ligase [Candidatus Paceibacterota bacterium]MBP9851242.1 tryptophan--tRNA ligase [Candidatus Paceibacterota bacterium]